jgi:hypothetical protein
MLGYGSLVKYLTVQCRASAQSIQYPRRTALRQHCLQLANQVKAVFIENHLLEALVQFMYRRGGVLEGKVTAFKRSSWTLR